MVFNGRTLTMCSQNAFPLRHLFALSVMTATLPLWLLSMHSDELWASNPRTYTHFGLGRMRGSGQLEGPLTVQDVLIKAAVKCKLAANYDYL